MNTTLLRKASKDNHPRGERYFFSKKNPNHCLSAIAEIDRCECGKTILRTNKTLWWESWITPDDREHWELLEREEAEEWIKDNL